MSDCSSRSAYTGETDWLISKQSRDKELILFEAIKVSNNKVFYGTVLSTRHDTSINVDALDGNSEFNFRRVSQI